MILRTKKLKVHFKGVKALDGVDIFLSRGLTTALAGESGCGKTTLARAILKIHEPTSGKIYLEDKDIALKENSVFLHRNVQIVFQNPFLSLDPRFTIFATLYEALTVCGKVKKKNAKDAIVKSLEEVELDSSCINRYPHQLSGGQLQRVCIARAIINRPALVILDEPTSSLDVTTASKIIKLLNRLKQELKVTFLFISHDLKLLNKISDFSFIMHKGKIVEYGPRNLVYSNPMHPYTKMLIDASNQKLAAMPKENCESPCSSILREIEPGHFIFCD
ncbi:MAG: ABC transporter ATP-binding protein [Candidatus Omnitrophica bacterium]|nr:ABC transporter ATP-binding protein [Candidatus Omnitrophota bacterium]